MESRHVARLKKNAVFLGKNLDVSNDDLLLQLYQEGILSLDNFERLKVHCQSKQCSLVCV